MKYRRMGIIGALRIVSTIAHVDVNAAVNCSSYQVCFWYDVIIG
jgi:Fanconi anemia group D2 protein